MAQTLNAKPGLNGNTREDFCEAYAAMVEARDAIETAAQKLLCDVANARNYQHMPVINGDWACCEDRARIKDAASKACQQFDDLMADIVTIVNG